MTKANLKQLNKEKILDQGVELLMERGYHGTGLNELLQRVGVPKGSFYNYFANKEAFSAEVVQHYIAPFIEQLDRHLSHQGRGGAAALEAYYAELIEEAARRQFKGGCLLGNLIGEVGDTSETCRTALREAVHRYRDKIAKAIAKGQAEGSFRQDKSAEEMADTLLDAWQGALLRMKIERSTRPLEDCCRRLLNDYFKA